MFDPATRAFEALRGNEVRRPRAATLTLPVSVRSAEPVALDHDGVGVFVEPPTEPAMVVRYSNSEPMEGPSGMPVLRTHLQFTPQGLLHGFNLPVNGPDELPLTRGHVLLGYDGFPMLCTRGRPIMEEHLSFGDDGALLGPQHAPVLGLSGAAGPVYRDTLLLDSRGRAMLDGDGRVVQLRDIVKQSDGRALFGPNNKPVMRLALYFDADDGMMKGPGGVLVRGRDGLPCPSEDVLVASDGWPLLTMRGLPILSDDARFAPNNTLIAPEGGPILGPEQVPITRGELIMWQKQHKTSAQAGVSAVAGAGAGAAGGEPSSPRGVEISSTAYVLPMSGRGDRPRGAPPSALGGSLEAPASTAGGTPAIEKRAGAGKLATKRKTGGNDAKVEAGAATGAEVKGGTSPLGRLFASWRRT
eukprot:NODE_5377_length_1777_cov_5.274545.p1 GENE.NODE_5377_length_1777_cov_5.274545~~NODE_5377_length_1777_cov_5.274545.p1  ORF type:complete len:414 (-),score=110.99 NODE_5377_length_1777_cov_5.274545:396-1637(-)